MTKLVISKSILARVLEACRTSVYEKIFLGTGYLENDKVLVKEVIECPNVSDRPAVKFTADPLCVYRVYALAENRGEKVVLLVHSHPAPPQPSADDVKGMEVSGSIVWLIVSITTGEYKAWTLIEGKPVEVDIEVVES